MLEVSRLAASMRYRLGDMQGARFSDFDLIEAINRAASLLFALLGRRYVWAAVKKAVMDVGTETLAARLPRDFHNAIRVSREGYGEVTPSTGVPGPHEYRISGDSFYAAPGIYALEYYYIPRPVHTLNDGLDAPGTVSPWIEAAAVAVLNNDMAGAEQACAECCDALAAGELSRFTDRGPVQVLGGKL